MDTFKNNINYAHSLCELHNRNSSAHHKHKVDCYDLGDMESLMSEKRPTMMIVLFSLNGLAWIFSWIPGTLDLWGPGVLESCEFLDVRR